MSRLRNSGSRFKGLAAVPGSRNKELAARDVQPVLDGTIASACELMGISLEEFIGMTGLAKETDPRVARFLDAWDALGASEQQARGTADAVCERIGLAPVELLRIVADVTCRFAMYTAQIIAALSHPLVVEKTVDLALNAAEDKDRLAAQVVLHKAMGFLPAPKGSQTIISILQNAQANAAGQSVALPRPEETIRRLSDRFNERRGLPPVATAVLPGANSRDPELAPAEVPEEEENDDP